MPARPAWDGGERLKILFLMANPIETERLKVEEEIRSIQYKLREVRRSGAVEIVTQPATRVGDLMDALKDELPHVIHFSGHGTEAHGILLQDDDGKPKEIFFDGLVDIFRLRKNKIRLVVFNACYSKELASALTSHIDCAIGMQETIRDGAAIEFATAFYDSLGSGESLQHAFELGKAKLKLLGLANANVPECFVGAGVDLARLILVHRAVEHAAEDLALLPDPTQVLLLLDLASDNPVSPGKVEGMLPPTQRPRVVQRLSASGIARTPRGSCQDWGACADGIARMLRKARSEIPDGEPAQFYVSGRAALPVFAHLGLELASWADVTLLNQRNDGEWDKLPLRGGPPPQGERFFKDVRGLNVENPSAAGGRVAVFVSTNDPVKEDIVYAFVEGQGEQVAGLISVHTGSRALLEAGNAPQAASELVRLFQELRVAYPRQTGVALFVAGPATLAFMAGRAINPHIFRSVWVPNYDRGAYQFTVALPWKERARPRVSRTPEDELARRTTLNEMVDTIADLQRTLRAEHLPHLLTKAENQRLLERVKDIAVSREPEGDAVELSVAERKMSFGRGLLDALRKVSDADRPRVGQNLFLYKLFLPDHDIQSGGRSDVSRAGAALEEVDYWADAFSVGALATWEISRGGERARDSARDVVTAHIHAALRRMEAFDRSEQGDRMDRLDEPRLRRYLGWHLQRARSRGLRRPEDIWSLFERRLIVDLAPLQGHLDDHGCKLVKGPLTNTEVLIVLQGRIARTPRQESIDPGALVDAVRTFNQSDMERVMTDVCRMHGQALTPWLDG